MKKSFLTLAVVVTMLVTAGQAVEVLDAQADNVEVGSEIEVLSSEEIQQAWNEDITNNVGNGQEYAYAISHVDGDKVYGVALNKKSHSNGGIFLYADEIPFVADEGDKIIVVWGEEEDEFEVISRAVQATDGTYLRDSSSK